MFEIVLFHPLIGRRPFVLDWAGRLRELGFVVHTPDLYDGFVFDDSRAAAEWVRDHLGFEGVLRRARESVESLSTTLVYAGFSNGGACAELLAATRVGARAAVLMHAPLQVRDLGWTTWPSGVPVQCHFAERDPIRDVATIDRLASKVRSSGSAWEQHTYDAAGHLFADARLPSYNPAAAALMWDHLRAFLEGLRASS